MFTKDELNILGVVLSNAPIKGSDAKTIAALLDKIAQLIQSQDIEIE